MVNLAIIGGGSWGTALSLVLAPRFQEVRLWVYEADLARQIETSRDRRRRDALPACARIIHGDAAEPGSLLHPGQCNERTRKRITAPYVGSDGTSVPAALPTTNRRALRPHFRPRDRLG